MTVAVITDTAAALPSDLAEALDVTIVPVWIVIAGQQMREKSVSSQEILERWDEGVTTSVPTPDDFAQVFASTSSESGTLVLTVSSALTGINQSAAIAARDFDGDVRVLDTGTGVGAQALIVLAAARAAAEGRSLDQVESEAEQAGRAVRLVATLGDLSHLVRSGRVPGIARWAGRSLNLNPIVELGAGKVRLLRPAFNRDAALERIISRVRRSRPDRGAVLHVSAFHSLDPEPADHLLEQIAAESEVGESLICEFGPAMVSHAGSGVVGMAWRWEADTIDR